MTDAVDAALQGLRVLVVDDETLVAMLLEDMLSDLGCTVAGVASRVPQAMTMARELDGGFDVAVLDVNVAGESIAPVAALLVEQGKAIVFATGYGESGVPEAFRGRPTLQKPFGTTDVTRALKAAAGR